MKRRCSHIKYLNGTPFTQGNGELCDLCGDKIAGRPHMNFYVGSFKAEGGVADMTWALICWKCVGALQKTISSLRLKSKVISTLTKGIDK